MKFNVKKFVIVLVLIIFVSFLISGLLFYTTGGIKSSLITSEQIKTNKSFGTEEVDKIVINAVSPNIKILPAGALSSTSVLLKFPLIFPLEEF